MSYGVNQFPSKWNRGHWTIFLLISLLCVVLVVYAGFKIQAVQETKFLVIEELQTGRILWQSQVKEGDKILYENVHSVYRDRVYQTYKVSPSGGLILVKVASSPKVLFRPYPGFGLPPSSGERAGDLVEVNLNKEQDNLVIAVGGELTDNRLTVGQQSVDFRQLVGDGAVVRVYVMEATCR